MELRKPVVVIGLVGLLLLDVVLIAWALWPTTPVSASHGSRVVSSPAEPTADGPTAERDDPDPTQSPDIGAVAPVSRFIAATSALNAWVAEPGSCGQPGRLFVTSTGGSEWSEQESPGSITRLRPSDGSSAFVVGGDANCAARVWYTGDSGASWSPPRSAADAWGRDPSDARLVLRPGGAPVRPCEDQPVVDLVGLVGASSVLCEDGRIRTSTNRGESWTTDDRRSGLLAISLAELGRGAAAGIEESCAGIAVMPIVEGRLGDSACVREAPLSGRVALSVTPGAVWLISGDEILRGDSVDATFSVVSTWPGG